jgi:hypothetical protein
MKGTMKHILIVAASLLAASTFAQTLSVSVASNTASSAGATVFGSITRTNIYGGVTNSATLRVFWGGADAGATVNYPVSGAVSGTFTNGQTFSYALTGMTPNRTIYYNVRATDLTGDAWLSSTGYVFTTSSVTGATPDVGFRENLRTGTNANIIVTGTATIATNNSTILKIGGTAGLAGTVTNTVISGDGSTNTWIFKGGLRIE